MDRHAAAHRDLHLAVYQRTQVFQHLPETSLPPEFSPAMLRAEAERLGLDPDRIGAGELASAVMRAMYARAPEGAGRTG